MANFKFRCFPYGDDDPIEITMQAATADHESIYTVETFDLNLSDSSRFKKDLYKRYGIYGYMLTNAASPIDMYQALLRDDVEIIEGSDLINKYKSSIPKNAQS